MRCQTANYADGSFIFICPHCTNEVEVDERQLRLINAHLDSRCDCPVEECGKEIEFPNDDEAEAIRLKEHDNPQIFSTPVEKAGNVQRKENKLTEVASKGEGGANSEIFISYRREDSEAYTGHIYSCLTRKFGKETIFRDVDNIPMGADFRRTLDQQLAGCRVLLAIIGPEWTKNPRLQEEDDSVRIEIESGLDPKRNILVTPVLVGNASMPSADQLPPSLKDFAYHNAVNIRPAIDFDRDMEMLINQLEVIGGIPTKDPGFDGPIEPELDIATIIKKLKSDIKDLEMRLSQPNSNKIHIRKIESFSISIDELRHWPEEKVRIELAPQVELLKRQAPELLGKIWREWGKSKLAEVEQEIGNLTQKPLCELRDRDAKEPARLLELCIQTWKDHIKTELATEIEKCQTYGLSISKWIINSMAFRVIEKSLSSELRTIVSVQNVLRDLNEAEKVLNSNEAMTPEYAAMLWSARERCAVMRANKKIAEARIAKNAGQDGRMRALKQEAEALLQNDWLLAFPEESSIPPISRLYPAGQPFD